MCCLGLMRLRLQALWQRAEEQQETVQHAVAGHAVRADMILSDVAALHSAAASVTSSLLCGIARCPQSVRLKKCVDDPCVYGGTQRSSSGDMPLH
jgi:hypothetical protein